MKYLTSISHVKIQITSYVTGAKVLGLTKKSCKEIKVPFPELPEQQKIASILSNLDLLIQQEKQYKEKETNCKAVTSLLFPMFNELLGMLRWILELFRYVHSSKCENVLGV